MRIPMFITVRVNTHFLTPYYIEALNDSEEDVCTMLHLIVD